MIDEQFAAKLLEKIELDQDIEQSLIKELPVVLIAESYHRAKYFCELECDPPLNIHSSRVVVVTTDEDVHRKLQGYEFPLHTPVEIIGNPRVDLDMAMAYISSRVGREGRIFGAGS
jgi:hypothetical protein